MTDKHPKRPRDPNQLAKSIIGNSPSAGLKALGLSQLERRGNGGPAQRSIVSGSHLPTEALVNFDHFSMISPTISEWPVLNLRVAEFGQ
jgi:hypothetical protein